MIKKSTESIRLLSLAVLAQGVLLSLALVGLWLFVWEARGLMDNYCVRVLETTALPNVTRFAFLTLPKSFVSFLPLLLLWFALPLVLAVRLIRNKSTSSAMESVLAITVMQSVLLLWVILIAIGVLAPFVPILSQLK